MKYEIMSLASKIYKRRRGCISLAIHSELGIRWVVNSLSEYRMLFIVQQLDNNFRHILSPLIVLF